MFRPVHLLTITLFFCTTSVLTETDPLFLTPLILSGNVTVARNLSLVLELPSSSHIPHRPSYSGLITVNDTYDSNLFFWFFPAIDDENAPIVLWLDGGPGVSNFLTIFTQNGPFYVQTTADGTFSLEKRLEDWTLNRSIIYLENPADVGFSFTTNPEQLPKTSEEAAVHSVEFLRQFFILFPEYVSNEFYLIGQSYGGHFAPAVATEIHRRNENNRQSPINFHGIMLLAPWTNPRVQVDSYADFMYQTGLIDEVVSDEIKRKQGVIVNLINDQKYVEAKNVWTNMLLNPNSTFNKASGFTTALTLLEDQLDVNNFQFASYVELPAFRHAIHVGNLTYTLISPAIQNAMTEEFMASKSEHIEELLRIGKYKVIIVTGQLDLTVIHTGIEKMLNDFVWAGQSEWKSSNRHIWKSSDGHVAGYKKEVSNLSLYVVRNAGHMITGDQPAWNFELVNGVLVGNRNRMKVI